MASTGVIGEPLPAEKITANLGAIKGALHGDGWAAAAAAIMTTDTYPKAATATAMIDGVKVTINGIAKGSGMIAPDMATMLSYVFTDANLPASVLQELLSSACRMSAGIFASVATKASMVAMSGAIMPEPLAMPLSVTLTPSIFAVAVASLG